MQPGNLCWRSWLMLKHPHLRKAALLGTWVSQYGILCPRQKGFDLEGSKMACTIAAAFCWMVEKSTGFSFSTASCVFFSFSGICFSKDFCFWALRKLQPCWVSIAGQESGAVVWGCRRAPGAAAWRRCQGGLKGKRTSWSYLSTQDAAQCYITWLTAGCDVPCWRASPCMLGCRRGQGRARVRGSCVHSVRWGGKAPSPLSS